MNDRLTLNLGLRWEYEPGADRPEQPAVAAARPDAADSRDAGDAAADAGAGRAVDGEQGLRLQLQRRLGLRERRQPARVAHARGNFMPRVGANYRLGDDSVLRFAYARFLMPTSNVRDTLGDFVEPVHRLRADHHHAGPGQRRAAADAGRSVSRRHQPGDRAVRPGLRPLHRPRRRRQPRPVRAAAADQRPLQPLVPEGGVGRIVVDAATSSTTARACRTTSTST